MRSLSVIVRTCGRPWFLKRSLASISAQSAPPSEVLVVNDGVNFEETDAIVADSKKAGLPVATIHNKTPLGRGGSLNVGMRSARSELLAFLDDDDTWRIEFLRKVQMEFAAAGAPARDEVGVVALTEEVFEKPTRDGWRECSRRPFNRGLTGILLQELTVRNQFTNNAFVFPKAALNTVGYYREDLPVLEDWEFNVRFAARFRISLIREPLACYHKRPSAASLSEQNTQLDLHRRTRHALRDAWLREDLRSGKFGIGALSLLSEIQNNHALRILNRFVSAVLR